LPCATTGASPRIAGKTCRVRQVSLGKKFRPPPAGPNHARIFAAFEPYFGDPCAACSLLQDVLDREAAHVSP
jgi:hypothetical protein